MTPEKRQWVVDNFAFTDETQAPDLINPSLTTDALLDFCWDLLHARGDVWSGQKVEVLAVRSDHPTYDGPDGHSGGNAIDLAPVTDDADVHFIQDVQSCPDAKGIGLGGMYQQYADACGGYNAGSKLFEDNDSDHVHIQVVGY